MSEVLTLDFFEYVSRILRPRRFPGRVSWGDSSFAWMKGCAPASVGSFGVEFVRAWADREGYRVAYGRAGCDLIIGEKRVEVRTSLQWRGGGFSFAQMRDESYDEVAMLAIEPRRVRIWLVPKAVCLRQPRQHGEETHWLRFDAEDPPPWLAEFLVADTGDDLPTLPLRLF